MASNPYAGLDNIFAQGFADYQRAADSAQRQANWEKEFALNKQLKKEQIKAAELATGVNQQAYDQGLMTGVRQKATAAAQPFVDGFQTWLSTGDNFSKYQLNDTTGLQSAIYDYAKSNKSHAGQVFNAMGAMGGTFTKPGFEETGDNGYYNTAPSQVSYSNTNQLTQDDMNNFLDTYRAYTGTMPFQEIARGQFGANSIFGTTAQGDRPTPAQRPQPHTMPAPSSPPTSPTSPLADVSFQVNKVYGERYSPEIQVGTVNEQGDFTRQSLVDGVNSNLGLGQQLRPLQSPFLPSPPKTPMEDPTGQLNAVVRPTMRAIDANPSMTPTEKYMAKKQVIASVDDPVTQRRLIDELGVMPQTEPAFPQKETAVDNTVVAAPKRPVVNDQLPQKLYTALQPKPTETDVEAKPKTEQLVQKIGHKAFDAFTPIQFESFMSKGQQLLPKLKAGNVNKKQNRTAAMYLYATGKIDKKDIPTWQRAIASGNKFAEVAAFDANYGYAKSELDAQTAESDLAIRRDSLRLKSLTINAQNAQTAASREATALKKKKQLLDIAAGNRDYVDSRLEEFNGFFEDGAALAGWTPQQQQNIREQAQRLSHKFTAAGVPVPPHLIPQLLSTATTVQELLRSGDAPEMLAKPGMIAGIASISTTGTSVNLQNAEDLTSFVENYVNPTQKFFGKDTASAIPFANQLHTLSTGYTASDGKKYQFDYNTSARSALLQIMQAMPNVPMESLANVAALISTEGEKYTERNPGKVGKDKIYPNGFTIDGRLPEEVQKAVIAHIKKNIAARANNQGMN